ARRRPRPARTRRRPHRPHPGLPHPGQVVCHPAHRRRAAPAVALGLRAHLGTPPQRDGGHRGRLDRRRARHRHAVGGGTAAGDQPAAAAQRLLRAAREGCPGSGPVRGQTDARRTRPCGGGADRRGAAADPHRRPAAPVRLRRARPRGLPPLPRPAGRRPGGHGAAGEHRPGPHLRRRAHRHAQPHPRSRDDDPPHARRRAHRPRPPRRYRLRRGPPRAELRRRTARGGVRMTSLDLAPSIAGALEVREAEGRTRALRALLQRPVLRAQTDGETFRLARRHADALRAWFDRETGWRLLVESQPMPPPTAHVPHGPTAVAVAERHPARARKADPPFTRRRYVLLCLALAVLERSDPQISLGRLAEEVVLAARQPGLEDVVFTLTGREERSDLVAAIRLLLSYGVLVRVAGDEESYVSAGGDALYDVDRRVLATMLSTTHSPGLV